MVYLYSNLDREIKRCKATLADMDKVEHRPMKAPREFPNKEYSVCKRERGRESWLPLVTVAAMNVVCCDVCRMFSCDAF